MSREHADQLQDLLERDGRTDWPLKREVGVVGQINEWRAFRESDATALETLCDWSRGPHSGHTYIPDPLPERIADAFADLIFGVEPRIEASKVTETDPDTGEDTEREGPDQATLDDLVDENDLPTDVQEAAARCVAEGEVWWRLYVDRDAFEHPVIEWHSRADVVPLYRGKKLLAAAFVSDLDDLAPDAPVVRVGDDADPSGTRMWRQGAQVTRSAAGDPEPTVWRYVEIQTGGLIRNLLFRGERGKLGARQPLSAHEQTADLPEEWEHGLEVQTKAGRPVPLMLAGRVVNGGRGGWLGRSQYAGVKHLLYELNKLASVGSRNVDTTMHKRIAIDQSFAEPATASDDDDGTPRGRARVRLPDAFLTGVGSGDEVDGKAAPMGVLEFSDAWAEALLAWDGGLTDKILTRCRVAPQLVGRHTEDAATGPALRARLLDSVLAAGGKARAWDDQLPRILQAAQMVDALPEEHGGCGHQWAAPEEPPTVTRGSVLPRDETDEAVRVTTLRGAKLVSRRTAIKMALAVDDDAAQEEEQLLDAEAPEPSATDGIRVPRPPIALNGQQQ